MTKSVTKPHRNPNGTIVDVPTSTKIGESVFIGTGVIIGKMVTIGHDTTIGKNTTIGDNSSIGIYTKIGDGVRIGKHAKIGNRVLMLRQGIVVEDHGVLNDDISLGGNSIVKSIHAALSFK